MQTVGIQGFGQGDLLGARMDYQTAVAFVLIAILALFLALHYSPKV